MTTVTPFLYARLVEKLPFLEKITEIDPDFSNSSSVQLRFADLSVRTSWSLTSPENATEGLPTTIWRVEGESDVKEFKLMDNQDFPFGITAVQALSPTASHLLVERRRPEDNSSVFTLYRGVAHVVAELAEQAKSAADRELEGYEVSPQVRQPAETADRPY